MGNSILMVTQRFGRVLMLVLAYACASGYGEMQTGAFTLLVHNDGLEPARIYISTHPLGTVMPTETRCFVLPTQTQHYALTAVFNHYLRVVTPSDNPPYEHMRWDLTGSPINDAVAAQPTREGCRR